MKRLLPAAVLTLSLICSCQKTNDVPDIIPAPQLVTMDRGQFTIPQTLDVACPDSSYFAAADFLALCINEACAYHQDTAYGEYNVNMSMGDKGDIVITEDNTLDASGGYILDVSRSGISICCSSYNGAIAAVATLGQMAEGGRIPAGRIEDSPRFAWRGFMLDVSRHFFTVVEVKALLSEMAMYKFNKFHWHLTDDQGWRLAIDAYPQLTENGAYRDPLKHNNDVICTERAKNTNDPTCLLPADRMKVIDGRTMYGGCYSKDDIREVVAWAASLGMDVIPEIDMPGHSLKIIESYPELSCKGRAVWGKDFSVPLCPGNDATLELAKTVYSEIFGLFPYGYIHIGADEVEKTHWEACPKCKARMKEYGLADTHDLQDWFVGEMEKFCTENGKTAIGWDEIAAKSEFSKDAVVQWWRTWMPSSKENAVKNGNKIIISPSEFYYMYIGQNRNSLAKVYDYEPVDDILKEHEDQILGVHGNLWTESVTSFETACNRLFPRMFAVSEAAWSQPENKDAADFTRRAYTHLGKLNEKGWNFRIPDPTGFCDSNVFEEQAIIDVKVPMEDVTLRYTADGSIPGGASEVFDGPLAIDSDCILKFRAFTMSGVGGETYTATYKKAGYTDAELAPEEGDRLESGLHTNLYIGKFEDCTAFPAKADIEFVSQTMSLPESPEHDFGLVFKGYVRIPEDGVYSFYSYSDDGTVLSVSGCTAVENDGLHSREEKSGQLLLRQGWHPIELRYFDQGGGFLEVGLILPDGTRRPFSADELRH